MTLTAEALDDYARQYYLAELDDLDIEEQQQALSMRLVADAVRGCDRVLEMGYGTGLTVRELRALGVPIEVLEGSPLLVEEVRRRHPELTVHQGMFEEYAPGPVYDAVLALHVAEHVDEPRSLFAHIATWLRPGGRFVVAVPNAESLHRRLAVSMGLQERLDSLSRRDHLLGHQRVYTLDGLRADVEAAGLRVVDELGWFIKVVPNAMMLEWDPALLQALFDVSDALPPRLLANIAVVAERP
jgi:SAM-dependent methyltransferase